MGKRVRSREELLENKEALVQEYNKIHSKSKKLPVLTKKERQALGIGKDQGKAMVSHAKVSSRKAKLVIDLIRGKGIDEAYGILKYTPTEAAAILHKLLKSAEANAVNNNELNRDVLYVSECYANQGATLKRIRARAQGRAFRIRKRTSHITLVLREKV